MLRIRNNTLFNFFTIILLIINYKFLYLVQLPGGLGNPTNTEITVVVSLLFYFILFYFTNKFNGFNFSYNRYIICLFVFFCIELLYSLFRYSSESAISCAIEAIPYLSLFSYFIFSCSSQTNLTKFIKILILFSSLVSFICFVELILYDNLGLSLFKIYKFNYGITNDTYSNLFNNIRNGRLRLLVSNLVEFTCCVSVGCLFQKKIIISKLTLLTNIFLTLVYLYYVSQSRSSLLILCLTAFVTFIMSRKSGTKHKLIIVSIILFLTFAGTLLFTISQSLSGDYSYSHRINEITFYFKRFLQSPLLGNGFIPHNPKYFEDLFLASGYDPNAPMSYSDIGFFGILGHFGIVGVIFYLVFLYKIFKSAKIDNNPILISILVMSIFSLISLSFFDVERLQVLAVYMAIVDGVKSYRDNVRGQNESKRITN